MMDDNEEALDDKIRSVCCWNHEYSHDKKLIAVSDLKEALKRMDDEITNAINKNIDSFGQGLITPQDFKEIKMRVFGPGLLE